MDTASLQATFEKNKVPILAAAGAGVVGLGLYAKKKKAAGGPAAAGTSASAGGQTAGMTGGAAYDSSASDLYGAIQPQLESLGAQLTSLQNLYGTQPPTPVPAPTANPTPSSGGGSTSVPGSPSTPTPVPVTVASSPLTGKVSASLQNSGYTYTPAAAGSPLAANGYAGRVDNPNAASTYYVQQVTNDGTKILVGNNAGGAPAPTMNPVAGAALFNTPHIWTSNGKGGYVDQWGSPYQGTGKPYGVA